MSSAWPVRGGAMIILGAAFCGDAPAGAVSCHLHAPDDYARFSKQALVIPAVGDEAECEQLNRERFGSRGWCHCTRDAMSGARPGPPDIRKPRIQPEQLP